MGTLLVCAAALLLAWSNGANDNLKGVATLRGSGTLSPRGALLVATIATAAGSFASIGLAAGIAHVFSGAGLLPDVRLGDVGLLATIATAAGLTILAATRMGMPTSTTHALLGALLGAALVLEPAGIDVGLLASRFALPLLVSPILAIGLVWPAAWLGAQRGRRESADAPAECVCVETGSVAVTGSAALLSTALPTISTGNAADCARRPSAIARINLPSAIDAVHVACGAGVCFARALNDTPKVAALLIGAGLVGTSVSSIAVGLAMVLGGVLQSERVARTMSERITPMRPAEGAVASLATGALVLGASALALPVSTTHVSCGALFGLGIAKREARWGTIARILTAWVTTLPLAAALAALMVLLGRALV